MQTNEPVSNPNQQTSSSQPTNAPISQQQHRDVSLPIQESIQGEKSNKWLIIGLVVFALVTLGIAGVFAYQNYQLKKQVEKQSPGPEVTPTKVIHPTPTTSTNPTANWKIYENTKYNFLLKYPGEFWIHPDQSEGIEKASAVYLWLKDNTIPVGQAIVIMVEENPDNLSFVDWLSDSSRTSKDSVLNPSKELEIQERHISGIKWLSFEESEIPPGFVPSGFIYWVTMKDDKIILMGLLNLDLKEYKDTIDQILSTFKFTN